MKAALTGIAFGVLLQSPVSADDAGVSFSKDIKPLLRRKCAVCHLTGKEAGNLALHPRAAWKSIVNHPSVESDYLVVAPGEPDKSYLIMKLEGTHMANGGSGAQMPFGAPPLDQKVIDAIRSWIADGAADN